MSDLIVHAWVMLGFCAENSISLLIPTLQPLNIHFRLTLIILQLPWLHVLYCYNISYDGVLKPLLEYLISGYVHGPSYHIYNHITIEEECIQETGCWLLVVGCWCWLEVGIVTKCIFIAISVNICIYMLIKFKCEQGL